MKRGLWVPLSLLVAFVGWTILVSFVDVQPMGPMESSVGFATINEYVHLLTDVHMSLYVITDWLSIIPLVFVFGFGFFGFFQLIRRKRLLKVDTDILVLGGFYIVVMITYIFFEVFVINYRPVLIEGVLEASYPSSTTMLVMCVIPTVVMQFKTRIKQKLIRKVINFLLISFMIFMVICRLISGVHWFTDIIGGILLSSSLVMFYYVANNLFSKKLDKSNFR